MSLLSKIRQLISPIPGLAWAVIAVFTIYSVHVSVLGFKLAQAEERSRVLGFVADSAQVASSELRDIRKELAKLLTLKDSTIRVLDQRIYQIEITKDSLDSALKRESEARIRIEGRLANMQTTEVASVSQDSLEVREALFDLNNPPFKGTAFVSLPPPPSEGVLDLDLVADPVTLQARIQCGEVSSSTGLRPANVLLEAPGWLTIDSVLSQQSPDICNPGIPDLGTNWRRMGMVAGGALVLGLILGK